MDFDETSLTFTDDELREALLDGYGKRAIAPEYGTPDFGMVENLRRNVYQFSVAKNHHELRTLTDALIDDEGRVNSFSEFQSEARKIDRRYNVDYLRTEYDTAIGAAETASEWASLDERGTDPMLRYVTVGDERVRVSHAALNGLQRPMSDPIWNTIYPPNGWNCRCLVQVVSGTATPQKLIRMPDDIPEMFQTNLAKSGLLFPKNHPYFKGIGSRTFAQALEYIPVENTYFDAKTPHGSPIEVSCLHRDHEQAQNVAATDILIGKGMVRKATLLPDIHKDDEAVKRRFYPAGELPPDPRKNADAIFDGHVFEIKQTIPNNMVRNINKAAQQARRVVIRLEKIGERQLPTIERRALNAKTANNLEELIVIFPDGDVKRY